MESAKSSHEPIDQHDELDATARGKPATQPRANGPAGEPIFGPVDEAELRRQIVSGESYHTACVRLVGTWAQREVPFMGAQRPGAPLRAVGHAG
jgi:hypothetical protein